MIENGWERAKRLAYDELKHLGGFAFKTFEEYSRKVDAWTQVEMDRRGGGGWAFFAIAWERERDPALTPEQDAIARKLIQE